MSKQVIFWIVVAVVLIGGGIALYVSLKKPKPSASTGLGSLGQAPKAGNICNAGLVVVNGICTNPSLITNECMPIDKTKKLEITAATYHSTTSSKSSDVTAILAGTISDNSICILKDNSGQFMNVLFGDVAPNEKKTLDVKYKLAGATKIATFIDNQSIKINSY